MSLDAAMGVFAAFFRATLMLAGPLLLVAVAAGVLVGLVQTATQINEAGVSFVIKVAAVLAALVFAGPTIASQLVGYTRQTFRSVGEVVR